MKIVLWVGNESNQQALANKIHSIYPIAGIVTETRKHKPKITLIKLFEKVIEKRFLASIGNAWVGMKSFFEKKYPEFPATKIINVENINSPLTFDFTKEINPDLIIVSGTSLIKEKLLALNPTIGIINLHTGLSPYIKGGPNCTNWCIAIKQFHLIGNTIMWIDKGIDTGNIVTTALTSFTGDENLLEIHIKVMEHAYSLTIKAIDFLAKGGTSNVLQSEIEKGKTYYSKQWGLKEKINLIRNLNAFLESIKNGEMEKLRLLVKTVAIISK